MRENIVEQFFVLSNGFSCKPKTALGKERLLIILIKQKLRNKILENQTKPNQTNIRQLSWQDRTVFRIVTIFGIFHIDSNEASQLIPPLSDEGPSTILGQCTEETPVSRPHKSETHQSAVFSQRWNKASNH